MKNKLAIFILFLIVFCLASCDKKKGMVKFSGDMEGLTSDVLYIYGNDGSYDAVDTLNVHGGHFSYKFMADTLVSAILLINNNIEYPIFFKKGDHIHISGNANHPVDIKVKGNSTNDDFEDFKKELKESGELNELSFNNFNTSNKNISGKVEDFISNHPSSLVSIYLLYKYFVHQQTPNYSYIKQLIGKLDKKLQKLQYIVKLSDHIEHWKNTRMGAVAPVFSLTDLSGEVLSRNRGKLQNKYILLTFWASWANNHTLSALEIKQLNRSFRNNPKFAIVNISLDTDRNLWKKTVRSDSLPGYQVCDLNGFSSPIVTQYTVTSLPAYFFIAPDGVVLARDMQGDALRRQITAALKQ